MRETAPPITATAMAPPCGCPRSAGVRGRSQRRSSWRAGARRLRMIIRMASGARRRWLPQSFSHARRMIRSASADTSRPTIIPWSSGWIGSAPPTALTLPVPAVSRRRSSVSLSLRGMKMPCAMPFRWAATPTRRRASPGLLPRRTTAFLRTSRGRDCPIWTVA